MGLFDVHAHLTDERLLPDAPQVLDRARAAGITTVIANGLNPQDNQAVLDLSRRHAMVKPALGLYPVDAVLADMLAAGVDYPREAPPVDTKDALTWLNEHRDACCAIGEVGLDGYWVPEAFWPAQEKAFVACIDIARRADRPLIIHTRKRERRTFELLCEQARVPAIWHCFGGRVKLARQIAETCGHYFSIPANVRRAQSFTRLAETLPRHLILTETDSPYLAPTAGETNEPASVAGTVEFLAELWREPKEAVVLQLSDNFRRLFGEAP